MFNKIVLISALLISFNSFSIELDNSDYNKIEKTFIGYAESNGDDIIVIDVFDFNDINENERISINSEYKKNPDLYILFEKILNGKWSNNTMIYNLGNKTVLLYPKKLKPINFYNSECGYISIVSDLNSCLTTYIDVKKNLSNVMNDNGIFIDNSYMSDFLYIHELSHLVPQQRIVPNFNIENVWIDDLTKHFGEIYSDLFSIIFLSNYLKYEKYNINDVVTLRNLKLHSSPDLIHYSVPYIDKMKNLDNWSELRSFEDIDLYIREIYSTVNNEQVISKKQYKDVFTSYVSFCRNIKLQNVKSTNVIKYIYDFCLKSK